MISVLFLIVVLWAGTELIYKAVTDKKKRNKDL